MRIAQKRHPLNIISRSLGRSKIYELLASGDLPSVTVGTARRIPLTALQTWVAERTKYGVE